MKIHVEIDTNKQSLPNHVLETSWQTQCRPLKITTFLKIAHMRNLKKTACLYTSGWLTSGLLTSGLINKRFANKTFVIKAVC